MNTPTDQQIKIDYLVDLIGKFKYVVSTLIVLCIILGIGMVVVATDNRNLRAEVKRSLTRLESHHAQIHANHTAMQEQYDKIAHKLKMMMKDK
ncbi:MAG: hypothetical protein IKW35_07045 [Paludibacteraceae bacterium]|nr:hypothetical protein [Paludibacteraceae bacterium]